MPVGKQNLYLGVFEKGAFEVRLLLFLINKSNL